MPKSFWWAVLKINGLVLPSDGGRKGSYSSSCSGDFFRKQRETEKGEGREKGERNLEINSYY